jgi:hypothetical protein
MTINLYILALDSKGLLVDLEVLSKALNEISRKRDWNLSVQAFVIHSKNLDSNTTLLIEFPTEPHIIIHLQQIYNLLNLKNNHAIQILVPNHEWFSDQTIGRLTLNMRLWHKTRTSLHLLENLYEKIVVHRYLGFTSPDPRIRVQSYRQFAHFKGKSSIRHTSLILNIWKTRPDFPDLKLQFWSDHEEISFFNIPEWFRWNNINLRIGYINHKEYFSELAFCGIHICTSMTEGFGHYINEAWAMAAIPLVIDAPPMNEFVDADSGLLISPSGYVMSRGVVYFSIDEKSFEKFIENTLSFSNEHLQNLGFKARERYESERKDFYRRLESEMDEILKDLS